MSTTAVPVVGGDDAALIVQASNVPLRVVIRNVGPSVIEIAHTSNELGKLGVTSGVFVIAIGNEEVFVLAPDQGIYAGAIGAAGRISYAYSDAIPYFMGAP